MDQNLRLTDMDVLSRSDTGVLSLIHDVSLRVCLEFMR
jgi:hypothetical protein